jgi:hypothetical protein
MLQEVFLSKTKSTLTRNNMENGAVSKIDGFLWRDTCGSSS